MGYVFSKSKNFYYRYLSRYRAGRAAKRIFVLVYNRMFSPRRRPTIFDVLTRPLKVPDISTPESAARLLAVYPSVRMTRLLGIADFTAQRKLHSIKVFDSENVTVMRPHAVPESLAGALTTIGGNEQIPAVWARRIENAIAIGNSEFILVDDITLHHELAKLDEDFTSEELHRRLVINAQKGRAIWYQETAPTREIPGGISLLGSCTPNYSHWISETLPKLAAVDTIDAYQELPLLVDADLPAQILESIRHVSKYDRELITVHRHEPVAIKTLVAVDPCGHVPFEPRVKSADLVRQGIFGRQGFRLILDTLREKRPPSTNDGGLRLFVRRNASYRRLLNEREIEEYLCAKGFKVVEPENLTFAEQFQLFSDASFIVGATGAAFANMIFAPSNAKVTILASANRGAAYYYWQSLAGAVGNTVTYVLGVPSGSMKDSIHADYKIELDDLVEGLALDEPTLKTGKNREPS